MNRKTQIIELIDKLIAEGKTVLATRFSAGGDWSLSPIGAPQFVDNQLFVKWRASCNFLVALIGEDANYCKDIFNSPSNNNFGAATSMQGTLESIREVISNNLVQLENQKKLVLEKSEVFIVHGRDGLVKTETARFIEQLGLKAIILHEQSNSGSNTIIEKIEKHTNVGFAIVLYTPCDVGSLNGECLKPRARQNVVFEHGYLIGKLGRQNVCALVKEDIEIPNDISGIVYIPLDNHNAWHLAVAKELRSAGYAFDMNKVI
jgi:predicted nucleotide-binding protein